MPSDAERTQFIIDVLTDAFSSLAAHDSGAIRRRYRTMAADPFAFYLGTACLFYADLRDRNDRWADERTSRVWIQGDLHVENFGTYMNSDGVLVFDVNDYDEAYLGHFTWDLMRFAASLAVMGWTKAMPDEDIAELTGPTSVPTSTRCTPSSTATGTTSGLCGWTPHAARCSKRCLPRSWPPGSTCWRW